MSAKPAATPPSEPVTIDDIRASLRRVTSPIKQSVDTQRERARVAAAVGVAAVVLVAFWLGRRSGRRHQTILEIRRV